MEETIASTGMELPSLQVQNLPTMKHAKLAKLTLKRFDGQFRQ